MEDRSRNLVLALGALVVLQVLHSLDELRTDDAETLAEAMLGPAGVLGMGGALVALIAVAQGRSWGRPLAVVTGVLVAVGFVVVHGIPTATEATQPYWGDDTADALQWLGVIAIWVDCAVVVKLARRSEEASVAAA